MFLLNIHRRGRREGEGRKEEKRKGRTEEIRDEEEGKERGMDGGDLADPNSAPIGFFFFLNEGPEARAAARRYSEYWMLPPPLPLSLSIPPTFSRNQ